MVSECFFKLLVHIWPQSVLVYTLGILIHIQTSLEIPELLRPVSPDCTLPQGTHKPKGNMEQATKLVFKDTQVWGQ